MLFSKSKLTTFWHTSKFLLVPILKWMSLVDDLIQKLWKIVFLHFLIKAGDPFRKCCQNCFLKRIFSRWYPQQLPDVSRFFYWKMKKTIQYQITSIVKPKNSMLLHLKNESENMLLNFVRKNNLRSPSRDLDLPLLLTVRSPWLHFFGNKRSCLETNTENFFLSFFSAFQKKKWFFFFKLSYFIYFYWFSSIQGYKI